MKKISETQKSLNKKRQLLKEVADIQTELVRLSQELYKAEHTILRGQNVEVLKEAVIDYQQKYWTLVNDVKEASKFIKSEL